MNILITGAGGFVGRNLAAVLASLRDGSGPARPGLTVDSLMLCHRDTDPAQLAQYCRQADFVFHLAGVNRPEDPGEFTAGNVDLTATLLAALRDCGNPCPVMLASSVQATLAGRYAGSAYGESKRAAEELVFAHGRETGAPVYVFRFPNLFGKWGRPDYNSVVATFCYRLSRGMPVTVHDGAAELELLYIDDLCDGMLDALAGRVVRCDFDGVRTVCRADGRFCTVPLTHRVTLDRLLSLLYSFRDQPSTLLLPDMPAGSLEKKLYATYVSYLPPEAMIYSLTPHMDARGSFTELLRSGSAGQVSLNVTKPGVTKGGHWHRTKWEIFMVVAGSGRIDMRRIDGGDVLHFDVRGDCPQAVQIPPGYTHTITNTSGTEDLITVMWANETYDPTRTDTYREEV